VSALEPATEATEVRLRREFEQTLEPGSIVFDEGDPGDQLYVIQSGEVELSREEAGGQRVVARLGAGDFFGELGVVLGQPCSIRAIAISKTRVLCLDAETLEGMCLGQPEIAIRMIRVLAGRLIEAERRLGMLGVDDLLRPMIRALLRGVTPNGELGSGDTDEVRIAGTLRSLAEEAGLTLLEAHRVIHQLFDRKVLDLVDDRLVATNLEALSASAD